MENFLVGVISSLSATLVLAIIVKWGWPAFQNQCLYQGIRIDGEWDIIEMRDVIYISMDEYGAWKMVLAKEMRNSGYSIDLNDL